MPGFVTGTHGRVFAKGIFKFRYTGIFDWTAIYREGREFWMRRIAQEHDLIETKYQHKGKKIDCRWTVHQRYDAYYQINYKINFRIYMPKTVIVKVNGKEKKMMQGAMRCWMDYGWDENYEQESPAGDNNLFPKQMKWLIAIYRKITWRERWDLVDDIGMFTCNDFNEFLKKETHMSAGGYSTIWEGG